MTAGIRIPSDMNLTSAFDYLAAHPKNLRSIRSNRPANSIEDDYDITENILALYLMGTVDWTEKLQMIYGRSL